MANITWLGVDYTNVGGVYLPTTGGGETLFHESGGGTTWETLYEGSATIVSSSPNYITINDFTESIGADEVWRVTWNGTAYTFTSVYSSSISGYYIGNPSVVGGMDDGSGATFWGYKRTSSQLAFTTTDSAGTITLKIEKQTSGGSATLITKSITANGTYTASDDSADGYSEVTVNVPSSGSSSWTLVASTSYQVSTASTSTAAVATWATGHSEIWTSDKIVCVRIRDTAGKRAGYFYGTDNFYYNIYPANGTADSWVAGGGQMRIIMRYTTDGAYAVTTMNSTSGYGVFSDYLYSDGGIRIRKRYNSSYSLTINGTYSVEVYLLAPPTNAPIFT